jgi:FtsP/CotA-like multicopper oxidase with cupredoxin domain
MKTNRRGFLRNALTAGGLTTIAGAQAYAQHVHPQPAPAAPPQPQSTAPPSAPATPNPAGAGTATAAAQQASLTATSRVHTPDVPHLPWTLDNGVKVFRLTVEPVRVEFLPGRPVDVWGFNGSMPGPTIEANEGDRVRLIVENRLPEMFAMHWHGLEIPIEMDGGPGISQDPIPPGGAFTYEFTLRQHGTYFYHSHFAMQEMLGLIGLFIIHPREAYAPRVDHDFGLIFQGWAILPNNTVPNTLAMEFNWLTINGKAGPATTPMLVRQGERVRIRMVNLGMDHHPIHLHGNTFYTVGTEAGRIPRAAWQPGNTVLVGVAQARDIEFEARNPGDWMLHCHLPHHMMNQMASMVGPLTMSHGSGMTSGKGMEEGMGMLRQGHALSDGFGPSLGRAIGLGADADRPVANQPLAPHAGHDMGAVTGAAAGATAGAQPLVAANASQVKGYPQDMWMVMDEAVAKPETHGLRPTWSGGMMGMMTMVRVLTPQMYDTIQQLKAAQARKEGL